MSASNPLVPPCSSGRFRQSVALAILALATAILPAKAGRISPELREELFPLRPDEQMTVIFNLSAQAEVALLDRTLKAGRATRWERHRRVIEALQAAARGSQGPFLRALDARVARNEIAGYTPYWISNLVVVRGTRAVIEELADRTDIDVVEPNPKFELVRPVEDDGGRRDGSRRDGGCREGGPRDGDGPGRRDGLRDGGPRGIVPAGLLAIHAPRVWSELGINGSGALIAGLDTGVDGDHPALAARWRGANGHPWQECWLDLLGTGTTFPNDGHGHGSHTMGTMAGMAPAGQDTVGVAWGAEWISCNAINQLVGPDFDNDALTAFQWFSDPDGNPNTVDDVPDVLNNSWRVYPALGGDPPYTACDSRWWSAIDNCEAAGVVILFAAGNEGPSPQTIGSPSDRAATPYNVFCVGAVDATSYGWPYPLATFSSRGPSACDVDSVLKRKPEVVAPGVSVYSCWRDGTYRMKSGTSMATPHVSGTVALMRSYNPDIDVDLIKEILIATTRDEGAPGEDNLYGNGFIDAFKAVTWASPDYGSLRGIVSNASNGGTPVPQAQVTLLETGETFTADDQGRYSAMGPAGTYTVEVTHPSFATIDVPGVVIAAEVITNRDFALNDIAGPVVSAVQYPDAVADPNDPLPIAATIADYSAIPVRQVVYRVNGGAWSAVPMELQPGGRYLGLVPGQPLHAEVDFYIRAVDIASNQSLDPPGAPNEFYSIVIILAFFADDFETDLGWVPSLPSDTYFGRWTRWAPVGTWYDGQWVEPPSDHSPFGTLCYETGQGEPGGPPGNSDVFGGCVTLTSPVIDLSNAAQASVSYWRWFARFVTAQGSFMALVSGDGGGSWTNLETLAVNANNWHRSTFDLAGLISFTNRVQFRFIACNPDQNALVEAAVDDFEVVGYPGPAAAPPSAPAAAVDLTSGLFPNRPNPFRETTTLRFRLETAAEARLAVYDPAGRLVRTLISGSMSAGEHSVIWDGRDERGRPTQAGVYFCELREAGAQVRRKMLIVK